MRLSMCLAGLLFVSSSVVACGSSSANAPENIDAKGTFAFEGDGWQHHVTSDDEYWQKGALTVIGTRDDDPGYTSADSWAADQYDELVGYAIRHGSTSTQSIFEPKPLGSGYWFGFSTTIDGPSDVYEAYYVEGKRGLHVSVFGSVVTQSDAEAVLKSAHML